MEALLIVNIKWKTILPCICAKMRSFLRIQKPGPLYFRNTKKRGGIQGLDIVLQFMRIVSGFLVESVCRHMRIRKCFETYVPRVQLEYFPIYLKHVTQPTQVWFNEDPAHSKWENVPQDWCLSLVTKCEVGWLGSAAALINGGNNLMFLDGAVSLPQGGGSSTPGNEIVVMQGNSDSKTFNVTGLHFNDLNHTAPWAAIGVTAQTLPDDSVWLLGGSTSDIQWNYGNLLSSWSRSNKLTLLPTFSGTSKCSRLHTWNQTRWENLPDAPWHGRHFHDSYYESSTNRLYVIGGGSSDASSQFHLELYNDIWYFESSSPSPSPSPSERHHSTCSLGSNLEVPAGCVTFGVVASMIFVALMYMSVSLVMYLRRPRKKNLSEDRRSSARHAVMRLLESDRTLLSFCFLFLDSQLTKKVLKKK